MKHILPLEAARTVGIALATMLILAAPHVVWSLSAGLGDQDARGRNALKLMGWVVDAATASDAEIKEELQEASRSRLASISRLEGLILTRPSTEEEIAEMYLRLGDLYHEEGRSLQIEAIRARIAACRVTQDCASLSTTPDQEGRYYLTRARGAWGEALERSPDFGRADEALFGCATAADTLGLQEEALAYVDALTVRFPESRWTSHARGLLVHLLPAWIAVLQGEREGLAASGPSAGDKIQALDAEIARRTADLEAARRATAEAAEKAKQQFWQ